MTRDNSKNRRYTNKYFLQRSQDASKDFFNLETLIKALKINTLSTPYDYI